MLSTPQSPHESQSNLKELLCILIFHEKGHLSASNYFSIYKQGFEEIRFYLFEACTLFCATDISIIRSLSGSNLIRKGERSWDASWLEMKSILTQGKAERLTYLLLLPISLILGSLAQSTVLCTLGNLDIFVREQTVSFLGVACVYRSGPDRKTCQLEPSISQLHQPLCSTENSLHGGCQGQGVRLVSGGDVFDLFGQFLFCGRGD